MNYLISKGVAPERLLPKAFGDTQPVASNATEAGRKQNRRIAFVLKEKR
jgi:outer membrane protein OmpA-like peptidoglycan-associated protein